MAMSALPSREVTVNGVLIPAAAIAAEARNHGAHRGDPARAWQAAARALALRAALLDAARASGLVARPRTFTEGRSESEDEALIRVFIEARVVPRAVDEAELRRIYDGDPERHRGPDLWELAHILIPARPDDLSARAQARRLATGLIAELDTDPRRFAALAAEHSACPSRAAGGCLGQIASGDTVPEFEAALTGLSPGQIAPTPIETRYGLHVVRLDAHAAGAVLPFEVVLPRLRAAAEKVAWVRAARALAEEILAAAEVSGLPGMAH
jgi:peptidyl-prolyl cis-trans isomerase C